MIPILTPEEMTEVDRKASDPPGALIERAGAAVASEARRLLGRTYGTRIVVIAGPGNNGADGRVAARILGRHGAKVCVFEPGAPGLRTAIGDSPDLVVDAAYGTGLNRSYAAPEVGNVPVLSVDIASGVSGLTGEVIGTASDAKVTVTFAALKTGHLIGAGPAHSGRVEIADIGLGPEVDSAVRAWLVTDSDVVGGLPQRPREAHKWQSAVHVVAGSPGMTGAPWLVSRAAMRSGAGYVRLGVPGAVAGSLGLPPGELVAVSLPEHSRGDGGWVQVVLNDLDRFSSLIVGPGLGEAAKGANGRTGADSPVGRLVRDAPLPVVIDADGLNALGSIDALGEVTAKRNHPTVITPHAGEYERLVGSPPPADRFKATRETAERSGAIVLLKGSTTIVAAPDGRVLVAAAGSSRLASAGTGDALSGVVGAFIARGLDAFHAAALAAHVHGRAAAIGPAEGLVASDLPELISSWLSGLDRSTPEPTSISRRS